MSLTAEEVRHIANLARLKITPDEERIYQAQMNSILAVMDALKDVDTTGVEPTSHANVVESPVRRDEPVSSLPVEKGLRNAPSKVGTAFAVPKIIE